MPTVPDDPAPLLTTTDAAAAVGVNAHTLRRWARTGVVTPAVTTLGGQYRWYLDDLRAQMRQLP